MLLPSFLVILKNYLQSGFHKNLTYKFTKKATNKTQTTE
ncbi:hypothetical protein RCH33_909 [Flavobacterium daejeonense]|nr:hypothetical protein RCH33_909 [Flavobacterium daejeonense]